jgi:hypothetical protein
MILFILSLLLFNKLYHNFKIINNLQYNTFKINLFNDNSNDHDDKYNYKKGYCEITFENTTENSIQLDRIKKNIFNKHLLDLLLSNKINNINKVNIIKQNTEILDPSFSPNIKAAGLLEDWNFSLHEE